METEINLKSDGEGKYVEVRIHQTVDNFECLGVLCAPKVIIDGFGTAWLYDGDRMIASLAVDRVYRLENGHKVPLAGPHIFTARQVYLEDLVADCDTDDCPDTPAVRV